MTAAIRLLVPLLLLVVTAPAEVHPLLADAAERWVDARYRWSFLQTVREWDGAETVVERLERYDPSRGEDHRWDLVKVDGRAPTAEESAAAHKRKNRPRPKELKPLSEYLDLEKAAILKEDEQSVSFQLPFQRTVGWSIPGEKISLTVTINKQTRLVERGQVEINGPFNIALGLAKVLDIDVDLELSEASPQPANTPDAQGTAFAVINKLGRRTEYSWSEFTRVTPPQ